VSCIGSRPRVCLVYRSTFDLVPLAIRVSMGKTLLYPDKYIGGGEGTGWSIDKIRSVLIESVNGPGPHNGYEGVLELVDLVYHVWCTRVCTHELVRHRIASYVQSSTRYIMHTARMKGLDADRVLEALELPGEYRGVVERGLADPLWFDAEGRYGLPLHTMQAILVKMNLRSLLNFWVLRIHPHAHREIRSVAVMTAALASGEDIPVVGMLCRKKPRLCQYYLRLITSCMENGDCG